MKFTPKSSEQLAQEEKERKEAFLWPNGEYPFEVLEADEDQDKNGNPMFKLKVKVFNKDKSQNLFEYVSPSWMEHKLRHLAEVCGLLVEYERGEIEAYQLVGKTGTCKIGLSKDKSGQYPDKNQIVDYVTNSSTKKPVVDDLDDQIPF